ncbi:MAG: hypothetical protein JW869_01465 [Candidatus Omnitrophica bacterium]|nr:hypothetical protein [Candidatus Omnitrophota bacterium]
MKFFIFGLKLLCLIVLLIVPIIVFFLLASLPKDILEKTPLYVAPLTVNGLWQAENVRKLTVDNEGNDIYELKLVTGSTKIKKSPEEAVYALEDDLFVRTTREAKGDLEMTGIRGQVFSRLESGTFGPEIKKFMARPEGYYADISVKIGHFTLGGRIIKAILVLLIAIFCFALYFPIVKAIKDLISRRNS